MDLIITILPVVTKDLPISPRSTPYDFFYRDVSSALLQLVNQWLNFTAIVVVVVVVVFTLKAVPVSTQYFLTSVLVQLTRTPSVVTG